MGSRAKRARNGQASRPASPAPTVANQQPEYLPVPTIDRVGSVFGDIKHLPRYDAIPDIFKQDSHPCVQMVSHWFFSGMNRADLARLCERPGVDRRKALVAIRAILVSFEPKHEHKEAGCAYLLDQWFTLEAA